MKRKFFLTGVLLIGNLLLSSCGNDDSVMEPVANNYLEVKVDGKAKTFSNVKARWVDGGSYLELTGNNNGNEWISITVLSETTRVPAGRYTLDDGTPYTILSTYGTASGNSQHNYTATKGTAAPEDAFMLDIDKISATTTSGTFSGMLVTVEGLTTLGTFTLTDDKFSAVISPN